MLLTSASESVTAYTIRSYWPCALRRNARPSCTLTETSGLAYGWAGLSRLEMSTMAGSISTESMCVGAALDRHRGVVARAGADDQDPVEGPSGEPPVELGVEGERLPVRVQREPLVRDAVGVDPDRVVRRSVDGQALVGRPGVAEARGIPDDDQQAGCRHGRPRRHAARRARAAASSTPSSANQTAGVVPSADSPANSAIPAMEPVMSMA